MLPATRWTCLIWCLFIVYSSLVPFQLRPPPAEGALAAFVHMPWLEIGLAGRIDWLANLVLYIPAGFLGTVGLGLGRHAKVDSTWRRLLAAGGMLALLAVLALLVEFSQIYFAPRTVSMNDVVAEVMGALIGCALAFALGSVFANLVSQARSASPGRAMVILYLVAYVALSFFPYDLSTATAVFGEKLQSGHAGWWIAPFQRSQHGMTHLKWLAEALLVLPFGYALARRDKPMSWARAGLLGLLLGVFIEVLQLFVLSAISQGASVVSRALGCAIGAALASHSISLRRRVTPTRLRLAVALLTLPWLAVLLYLAGWGRSAIDSGGWQERLASINFVPFFYHYFVGEAKAITSVLLCVGSYAWVGMAAGIAWPHRRAWGAALVGGVAAGTVEASRLMLPEQHPDPTNVLIAACAAALACLVARQLTGAFALEAGTAAPVMPVMPGSAAQPAALASATTAPLVPGAPPPPPGPSTAYTPWAVALGGLALLAVPQLADLAAVQVVAIAALAWAVWQKPVVALFALPVCLGLTDHATYTGVRWFEASDALMLLWALVALARPAQTAAGQHRPRQPWGALWLVCAAMLPGVLRGLSAAAWGDPNALLTPLGSGQGWLLAKGVLWPFVLVAGVRRLGLRPGECAVNFGRGMSLALAGVVSFTVLERIAFVGPFSFGSDYRAPGPFAAIALGGAYIEAFLVAAAPFALVGALRERLLVVRVACAALVLAATYATMVTFSRGGQVVLLVTLGLALAALASGSFHQGRRAHIPAGAGLTSLVVAAVVAAIAGVILAAPYAVSRFQSLNTDAQGRLAHWKSGLGFGGTDLASQWLGNGLGSFARDSYVLGPKDARPGMYTLMSDQGRTWLRMQPGALSYLDQRVDVRPGEPLTVSARLRSDQGTGISALLCEKDLVQSRDCGQADLRVKADGQWHEVSARLSLPVNPEAGWPPRSTRFTLFGMGQFQVDIDDLRLTDASGRAWLLNGSFSQGNARWLYASDMHLTWHLKNLLLQVYFELGWLGLFAHVVLFVAALLGAWQAARRHHVYFLAFGLSVIAIQGVGLIDSVIDHARFSQLYLSTAVLAWWMGRLPRPARPDARKGLA